jgi:hypothetical protein
VAVPGVRIGPLRDALGAGSRQVAFADMTEAGRTPGRLTGAMRDFADAGCPLLCWLPAGRPIRCWHSPVSQFPVRHSSGQGACPRNA